MTFRSELDAALAGATGKLLQRIEDSLPADGAAIVMMYNRTGEHLDLVIAQMHGVPGDILRILRTTIGRLLKEENGAERYYVSREIFPGKFGPHADVLVSSAAVVTMGRHDRVRLWSRGDLAGELVVTAGDGERIAAVLGLEVQP